MDVELLLRLRLGRRKRSIHPVGGILEGRKIVGGIGEVGEHGASSDRVASSGMQALLSKTGLHRVTIEFPRRR